MDARFYNSDSIDLEQLAGNLENIYRAQGFQAQHLSMNDQVLVQLKKGSDFEALIGLQAALTVILQHNAGGTLAMIGQQKWIDKAAVGAVGIIAAPVLWPLMITAGAGAIRQASLGNQVLNMLDGLVRQLYPEIQVGPVPVQIMPQVQQRWVPAPPQQYLPPPTYVPSAPQYVPPPQIVNALPSAPPTAKRLRCPSCNTPYEPGDTFCTGCGKSLVTLCPNCKTEVSDNASFCPKCGASIFQSMTATQAAPPVAPLAPTQSYNAPTQAAPAYTPPTPTYTPPPTIAQPYIPPAPSYTPPVQQMPAYTPPAEPEPYVPPTPQEPPVVSQPQITYVPSAPTQGGTPPAPPKKQEEVYYTPPADLQAAPPRPQTPTPPVRPQPIKPKAQTPPASQQEDVPYYTPPTSTSKSITPKPSSQPTHDPNATWGYLTFSDGKQVPLSGESALVGRYDHDIGGTQPQVDLSNTQGSDTVSRIHATLEHIGGSYTLTDLNSTNSTRLNGKRLDPDKAMPINDGDSLSFGKVTCTFKKA